MARTERDTWDLANSVGATATMVAAARAAASRRPQPVISDPFAEPLVRAVGLDLFTRIAAGELDATDTDGNLGFPRMIDTFAARAVFFDDYFAEAGKAGLQQVVIVASGLDSRPYRLSWPAGTTVYEIDQPEVLEFKTSTLAKLGAVSNAEHRAVGIDLRDDWPAALQGAGFDTDQPTAWLAEGLLIGFLPQEAEVRLLDNIVSLSGAGSRLAADYGQVAGQSEQAQQQARLMTDRWRALGLDLDIAALTYPGEHTDVAAHLSAHGWSTITSDLAELFIAAGLAPLGDADRQGPANSIGFVRAVAP
ncbi:SAM-dependent methyltransferase [Mycobacterium lacus]|uniref:S-adenosyl-L-methionine-dependent methyltransferase n=1 Tax=Mycobacterium lacus TaxID=169765 RepID=A0A1X1XZC0_9MYCO|nr:SAM-dependent methyltransferase [Mycobacterium lacus]MCV7124147.1 SAM-dependent methyltransferase [Mycobacterium lacus]ORW04223.1 SAM-dependent methyltransferase [Mycobacterium lacus]BBX97927.1 putative S-adenosyl-L-methionine-dependent methyltransferase [Mycobacterium lacus]